MRLGRTLRRGGSAFFTSSLLATLLVIVGVQHERTAPSVTEPVTTASGSTYLCTGYTGCKNAGYPNAGYAAVNNRMFWRMYPGHNCTNYAAYRMVRAGMPNSRPWTGGGNASEWGLEMSKITDGRPAVGAVAWWARYDNGSGSAGHVAYVERVVSSTKIVISEDSWGGDFHWRTITKDSGRWPTGFIHFVDKALQNTTAPRIIGTPQVGVKLTATGGSWKPAGDITRSYQWYAAGAAIPNATAQTFVPTAEQRGKPITVTVRAKKPKYTPGTVRTAATAPVARGEFTVVAPSRVDGTPIVGEVLTAVPASWSPRPTTTVVRWYVGGQLVEGQSRTTLRVTDAMVGKRIRVGTGGRAPGYRNSPVPSQPIGPVALGPVEEATPTTVAGTPRVGEVLTATPGTFTPSGAAVAFQWLRDGAPISGATGTTYRLTGDDLGARIELRVTATRRHYLTHVGTVGIDGVVTTKPTLRVRTVGKPRRAVVLARVTAPGLNGLPGRVTVQVAGRTVRPLMFNGRARVVVTGLEPGVRKVRVSYPGSATVEPTRFSGSVRVRR